MKPKFLLLSALCFCAGAAQAQIKAYAITGTQKGSSNWTEVRLVDASTGNELRTIYQNKQEVDKLNARTGKPIVKSEEVKTSPVATIAPQPDENITIIRRDDGTKTVVVRKSATHLQHMGHMRQIQKDEPFATTSAALAYDKKHDRLYYTPMGINELRFIDMKSKTTKIYYFEGEAFGALAGRGDIPNQVTRMVIGSDGKGYALTNSAEHLIQFETDKKPEVKDLGALVDDAANGSYSVYSRSNYGGDLIADAQGNLWLIAANRRVYKIDLKTMVATYKGSIKGLPAGFSTNGAVVEKDGEASVIVCSSTSTQGYFRFDLNTLQAEKASGEGIVYNASDLANGNLAFSKKKKKNEEPVKEEEQPVKPIKPADEPATEPVTNTTSTTATPTDQARRTTTQIPQTEGTISIFPNPVTTGVTKLSFREHAAGRYQVQVMDISGKILSTQSVTINSRLQTEELRLPQYIAKGSYMVKVVNEENKVVSVNPIIVQ